MRLIIDGRRLGAHRTGVGRYLEGLLEEWAVIGPPMAETIVVLRDPTGSDAVPMADGLHSLLVAAGWPGLVWERWGLGRVLRPGDLLFAPTNLSPAGWRGMTVLVAFDTLQDVLPESFPRLVRWRFGPRYRRAARSADRIIVPSKATAVDVERHYGVDPRRIVVIRPAPGPSFRRIDPGSEILAEARSAIGLGDRPYFLFLGKRSKRRNVPAILDAFARFRRDYPEARLVFAGPGDSRGDLGADPNRLGIVDAGHVAESILPALLSGAVALLYPSNYEGFGLPIVEAMACGCPVVTLRNSALTEAGGDAALYLDSPEPEQIESAMRRLWIDRDEYIARGLAWVGRWSRRQFAEAVKSELIEVAGA